jgi:hypothetical protein
VIHERSVAILAGEYTKKLNHPAQQPVQAIYIVSPAAW